MNHVTITWFFLTLGTKFEHLVFFREVLWSCILLIFLLSWLSTPLPSISFCQPFPPSLPAHLSLLFLWCFTYSWEYSLLRSSWVFVFTQIPCWNTAPHCPLNNLPANKLFRHTDVHTSCKITADSKVADSISDLILLLQNHMSLLAEKSIVLWRK